MDKRFFKMFGLGLLAFIMLVISSCTREVNYDGSTDKVISLGTPNVNGKIYPGVNYVYWDKVANAKNGYDWYVYENGVLKNTQPIHTNDTFIIDTDVNYKVTKHYKVWATGDSAARAIYYQEGKAGGVTLTPIVPPYSVESPIDLALYENGYEEGKEYTFKEEDLKYLPLQSNIEVITNSNGTFTVSFPVKAYLSYNVYADNVKGNKYSLTGKHDLLIASYQDCAVNNKVVSFTGKPVIAGTYKISVEVSVINSKYLNGTGTVSADKQITYEAISLLDSYAATNVHGSYNSTDSVKLTWNPARLASGEYVPVENYKVYKQATSTENYEEVTGKITSTYIPGSTRYGVPVYQIEDTDADGSSYIYTFVITDGKRFAGVYTYVTISSLGASVVNYGTNNVSAAWKDKETVRLMINPVILSDGSISAPKDYIVCRKVRNAVDSEYAEIKETISATLDSDGNKVYFVDTKVTDNTVGYTYAVYLTDGNGIINETVNVAAFTEALKSDLSVSFVSDDADGIENDVKVVLTKDNGESISSVKYMVLDSTDTGSYLDADYTNVLALNNASVMDNEYSWIIKNVAVDSYVSVSAVVDGKAIRRTTTAVSALEPAESAESTNFMVSVNLYEANGDNLSDDAVFVITRPSVEAQIKATYATGADAETAKENALSGNKLTLTGDYVLYYITKENVVKKENEYVAVALTISEPGKKDTVIYDVKQFVLADTNSVAVSTPVWKDNNADKKVNDVYFNVTGVEKDQKLIITYATAEDKETAKKYLDTSKAKTLVSNLSGYENYEFDSRIYELLGDFDTGLYFAARVTVSQNNKNPVTVETVSETVSVDLNETKTKAPVVSAAFVSIHEDKKLNDLYVKVETGINQDISKVYYATVTSDEWNASNDLLDMRIESQDGVQTASVRELYRTTEKKVYETVITDFDAGTYVEVKAQVSETGLEDNTGSVTAGPVPELVVTPVTTAAPVLSTDKLYFTSYSNNAIYNDIKRDNVYITLDVDQYIKSMKYVCSDSVVTAKTLFDSTKATEINVPSNYDLSSIVTDGVETLYKTYTYSPYMWDVPVGNYYVVQVVISQTGYEDYVTYLSTTAYTESYDHGAYGEYIDGTRLEPATETAFIPAFAAQKSVRAPDFIVSNKDKKGNENELVHVIIHDVMNKDSTYCYKYKLERTLEKTYSTTDDDKVKVWETVEDDISLSWYSTSPDSQSSELIFDKYYKYENDASELDGTTKDVEAGNVYVYRVTKTRKDSYSLTGKEESVTVSRKVAPQRYVDSPEIKFVSYLDEDLQLAATETFNLNYEYLDLYDYNIFYYVTYDGISTYEEELTGWEWEDVSPEADGSEYRLKNAVITDHIDRNHWGRDYSSAVVYAYIVKTLKSYNSVTDRETANLNIYWGTDFTINADPGISVNTAEYPTSYYLTATTGFVNYTWYINGNPLSTYLDSYNSDNNATISKDDLVSGSNEILLIAEKANGLKYSASVTFVK